MNKMSLNEQDIRYIIESYTERYLTELAKFNAVDNNCDFSPKVIKEAIEYGDGNLLTENNVNEILPLAIPALKLAGGFLAKKLGKKAIGKVAGKAIKKFGGKLLGGAKKLGGKILGGAKNLLGKGANAAYNLIGGNSGQNQGNFGRHTPQIGGAGMQQANGMAGGMPNMASLLKMFQGMKNPLGGGALGGMMGNLNPLNMLMKQMSKPLPQTLPQ